MRNRVITATVLLIGLCGVTFGPAHARTWYVNVSGTGDAPTIAAALDSAVVGDTVLVGPGEYTTTGLTVGEGVVVASEMGPLNTYVHAAGPGQAPVIFELSPRSQLHGFWVTGAYLDQIYPRAGSVVSNNIIDGRPGSHMTVNYECTISNNLFLGGVTSGVQAVHPNAVFLRNIILCAMYCESMPVAFCNDFVDTTSPCVQTLLDPYLLNFSADPQFCGVEGSDNYYLQSDSPCAEGNTPDPWCGQVGPLPVGCETVKAEARSWGEVKAMYRE